MSRMLLLIASASLILCTSRVATAQRCEGLQKAVGPGVTVTLAERVAPGAFRSAEGSKAAGDLPAFCRVVAVLIPTPDSHIGVEVWLPETANWNGKFMATGSGGWGGSIGYGGMEEALRRGYATSATDDGHTGASASFLMGHPERFVDFAYRAEHGMTVVAKSLIKSYYGKPARLSYWNGCSGGGREGLLQVARFPEEFDGVIAGDPADVRRNAWVLWLATETYRDPEAYIPPAKYPMIHQFVLNACDANDGVKDGLIENPTSCQPDFAQLACKAGGDGADCLTPKQVHSAMTIVSPAAAGSRQFFPRLEPGTELRWARVSDGKEPAALFADEYRFVVFRDPAWDWRTFDLARDAPKAATLDADVDALRPDLGAFAKHGGKLLLYHGWADQQVAPGSTVEFYEAAAKHGPVSTGDWMRLFMAPGMAHCSGGEGPDRFDKIAVLEQWVEAGRAPERIVATHQTAGKVDRTRPLCPYPETAHYKDSGSVDEAANFECRR